ncbi:MAG TPA: glycosyltransferase [Candidatus Moranbacteria bacterium]|nr:glycosyltransferase [Candidatus Moranbacteria bacterium]HRY28110.1 glycosyltransferase [Candidatus Moranbacteria bacterium]HSA08275.1 glycosyltransferase [Candidatus Moranbacteria bacterium]
MEKPKIALVHDFLLYPGGAERVLKVLADMYPEAPIYTLLYNEEKIGDMFKGKDIRPSYLQKFPKFLRKHYRWLLPFFPVVPETFDFREYDLVISSSGAWTKGIVTKLDTTHVAYLHSPMRFVWDYNEKYLKEQKKKPGFFLKMILNYLRVWDRLAAERPDYIIANSRYTQKRVAKYYRRESVVIYPPVNNNDKFPITNDKSNHNDQISNDKKNTKYEIPDTKYFLIVSRLSSYKKVDVAVEAFNKLGLPLVIIGQGSQEKYLRKIAGENIRILGWQNDETTRKYFQNARAFIFPCEDDFGIAPVEAMAHGVPVVALRKGGVLETVQEGITGEFFDAQTPEVLADGVRRFMLNENKYDKNVIKARAQEFSEERFKREFSDFVEKITNKK